MHIKSISVINPLIVAQCEQLGRVILGDMNGIRLGGGGAGTYKQSKCTAAASRALADKVEVPASVRGPSLNVHGFSEDTLIYVTRSWRKTVCRMQSFGRGMPGIWGEGARCEGRRIPAREESAGAMGRSWEPRRDNDYDIASSCTWAQKRSKTEWQCLTSNELLNNCFPTFRPDLLLITVSISKIYLMGCVWSVLFWR